jgi:hypothetical protein
MSCNKSILFKAAIILVAALALAYVVVPSFRGWLLSVAPILISLLCPLSMLFCMRGMSKCANEKDNAANVGAAQRGIAGEDHG